MSKSLLARLKKLEEKRAVKVATPPIVVCNWEPEYNAAMRAAAKLPKGTPFLIISISSDKDGSGFPFYFAKRDQGGHDIEV